jgi:hypothetical protein
MKKALIILITVILAFSCTPKEYHIEGKVTDQTLNGTTVFIKERINRVWISIDSVVIENGKFTFCGISDSARIAYLTYEFPESNKVRQAFVLENGKITVSVDSTGFMTIQGTKQNDLLQTYQNEKQVFGEKNRLLLAEQKDGAKTEEEISKIKKEIEELEKEEVKVDIQYAINHVNSIVGTHVFLNSFFAMSIPEKESIVDKMNIQTRSITRVSEIIADIEIEKKVSSGQHT